MFGLILRSTHEKILLNYFPAFSYNKLQKQNEELQEKNEEWQKRFTEAIDENIASDKLIEVLNNRITYLEKANERLNESNKFLKEKLLEISGGRGEFYKKGVRDMIRSLFTLIKHIDSIPEFKANSFDDLSKSERTTVYRIMYKILGKKYDS